MSLRVLSFETLPAIVWAHTEKSVHQWRVRLLGAEYRVQREWSRVRQGAATVTWFLVLETGSDRFDVRIHEDSSIVKRCLAYAHRRMDGGKFPKWVPQKASS